MVSRCNLSVVLDIPLLQHYFRSQHSLAKHAKPQSSEKAIGLIVPHP